MKIFIKLMVNISSINIACAWQYQHNDLCAPRKDQPRHPPRLIRVFAARRSFGCLATHKAHIEDWLDWADAQTDLSLRWTHRSLSWFIVRRLIIIWASSWENLFMPYANNKGTDQPAHLRSLISAIAVHCLDSIIPLVSISEISSLYIASVAAQAGLSLPWSQTPKTYFLVTMLKLSKIFFLTYLQYES